MFIEFGFQVEKKGDSPLLIEQVHGREVVQLEEKKGSPPADGIWTINEDPIYVFTADCLPLLLGDGHKTMALHCGWRGALGGIVKVGRGLFKNWDQVEFVLGPCIHACCFEVKDDFVAAFQKNDPKGLAHLQLREGKKFFDLVGYVKGHLDGAKSVYEDPRCTHCSVELPSYRRDKAIGVRIRSWVKRNPFLF